MHDAKVAESRWQVAPGDACAVAVQHGIDEQAVVLGCGSRLTTAAKIATPHNPAIIYKPGDGVVSSGLAYVAVRACQAVVC